MGGQNDDNQVGLGLGARKWFRQAIHIPVFTENDINIESMCCGAYHSMALSEEGCVFAWGRNLEGQCGMTNVDEKQTSINSPTIVHFFCGIEVVSIKCGYLSSGCMTE